MSKIAAISRSTAHYLLNLISATAIALAPGAGPFSQAAHAQPADAQRCFEVVLKLTDQGKAILRMPIKVLNVEKGSSRTLVEIDPKCLDELSDGDKIAPPQVDKYNEARKAIDQAVEGLGPDTPPETKAKIKDSLNEEVDQAEKFKAEPAEIVGKAAETNAADAENSDDKDTATLAAVGAVAAACMIASAGICAAAVAAILPSILPAEVSSKDVAGVARAVQSVAGGQSLSPQEIESIIKVLNTKIKVKPEDEKTLREFLAIGPIEAVKERIAQETGIPPEKITAGLSVLRKALDERDFSCEDLRTAFGINEIKLKDTKLRDRILASLGTMRNSSAVTGQIKECLDKILVVL